jgi:hypothetical protein
MHDCTPDRALSPREFGRRYRLSPDTVRNLIRAGRLGALNLSPTRSGKPRYLILPRHVLEWERRNEVPTPVKPAPRHRRQQQVIDFYPD